MDLPGPPAARPEGFGSEDSKHGDLGSGNFHAVTAVALGRVQGQVRLFHQLIEGLRLASAKPSNPKAGSHYNVVRAQGEMLRPESPADAFHGRSRTHLFGVR